MEKIIKDYLEANKDNKDYPKIAKILGITLTDITNALGLELKIDHIENSFDLIDTNGNVVHYHRYPDYWRSITFNKNNIEIGSIDSYNRWTKYVEVEIIDNITFTEEYHGTN